jgi:hypothetical protein
VFGYDGIEYKVGDRVEIHPATDLWMMGARYGTVVGVSLTVKVSLDKVPGTRSGTADTFRLIEEA